MILHLRVHRTYCDSLYSTHTKKRFTSFPSPAGMSLTKLPLLGRNNSVMTSLFPPKESLVVTSRLGTGNSRTFFLRCRRHSVKTEMHSVKETPCSYIAGTVPTHPFAFFNIFHPWVLQKKNLNSPVLMGPEPIYTYIHTYSRCSCSV